MPLTVLTDQDVRTLLHSLTKTDILNIQQSLADALHYYSTAVEDDDNGCCASYQPKRTQLTRKDGSTTLFMPANSMDSMGVKIVTLSEICANSAELQGLPNLTGRIGSLSDTDSAASPSGSSSTREGSTSNSEPLTLNSRVSSMSLGSGSTGATSTSISSHTTPFDVPPDITAEMKAAKMKGQTTSPSGSLTLLNRDGTPRGMVNAAEITAFRTALASLMLFKKRKNVHDVVIFGACISVRSYHIRTDRVIGAGKQAYWHARLALLLRGAEIHHLNFINRSFENVMNLIHDLYKIPWPVMVPHPKTSIITPAHTEYPRHLKSTLRASSVIFCTTPSLEPLFPPEILTSTEGRKKGRYISAIGSYKPHMIELHTDIIKQAVKPHDHHHHHHKHAKSGGAVIVDSVDACLSEAGEIIQAGIGAREIVELGELMMLKRDAERQRQESMSSLDGEGVELQSKSKGNKVDDGGLKEWLEKGNVIYKSVGLGLMDVVVGKELCDLADRLKVGTRIEGF